MADNNTLNFDLDAPAVPTLTLDPTPEAAEEKKPEPAPAAQQPEPDYEDNEEYEDERDSVAETLIRWVPPITAILCAAIALCGFVYYQFVL